MKNDSCLVLALLCVCLTGCMHEEAQPMDKNNPANVKAAESPLPGGSSTLNVPMNGGK